jgi:hypothetical protein
MHESRVARDIGCQNGGKPPFWRQRFDWLWIWRG